ncbi:DUF2164 domain-containing protein [Bacillus tuaregi]|uniref:DUF2164 domain-containing protein n=1 Tax=Bacillus tuaregi TaxID=1816695 RepID=UPI0008F8C35B|nr:DUF2164 domain-containing protein [Bacillus tuaregi]
MFFKLTKEQQDQMISDIQTFFFQERDEELTEFAAERVLDFVKESLAPHFYNAAISDAKHVIVQQFASLEDELLTLERPLNK